MLYHDSKLSAGPARPQGPFSVTADTLLSEIAERPDLVSRPYLFVVDKTGKPLGVVATAELLHKLTSSSPVERKQWLRMPVEAALANRIQTPGQSSEIVAATGQAVPERCTIVSESGSLLAVVTDDDVLISWRSIEHTLKRSLDDTVTQLPGRAAFEQHLKAECNRAERCGHSVAAILIDLDHFKTINDRYGHAAGDAALLTVGQTLRRTLRSYDLVARYGGDEFAAICCGCRPGEIEITIRKLHQSLKQLPETNITCPIPTLSIGACVVHDLKLIDSPERIVEQADECLYVAKRSGRDCSFTSEIGADVAVHNRH